MTEFDTKEEKDAVDEVFDDVLECNKGLIFLNLFDSRLAWFYNEFDKKWDIVYKISRSSIDNKFWIVTDCHSKYYAIKNANLYSIPPSDKLRVKDVIKTILNSLNEKFIQTALIPNKQVMCEFKQTKNDYNYFLWKSQSQSSSSLKMCKIDDYYIENNLVNGFFITPMGNESIDNTKPKKKYFKKFDQQCVCHKNTSPLSPRIQTYAFCFEFDYKKSCYVAMY